MTSNDFGDINPTIIGDDNNNKLGASGNDVYYAKKGNDIIKDYWGDDTYLFAKGDGWDVITDSQGSDKIVFGTGIGYNDLSFEKDNNALLIKIKGTTDGITVVDWFANAKYKIDNIQFQDGTKLTSAEVDNIINGVTPPPPPPVDPNSITGTPGIDTLTGTIANNTYEAKAGNDIMVDPGGNDTYLFRVGDGQDFVTDTNGTDVFKFGSGITKESMQYDKSGNNLVISNKNTTDKITVTDWFANANNKIEQLQFDDGTTMTASEIDNLFTTVPPSEQFGGIIPTLKGTDGNDKLSGTGNDIYYGQKGYDVIKDYSGNDTYLFAKGDGWDTVTDNAGNDKILFATGITKNDVTFVKNGNALDIKINGTSDGMTITNWFDNAKYKIEQLQFDNGTSMTSADIDKLVEVTPPPPTDQFGGIAPTVKGTEGNDKLSGTGNDIYYGQKGYDIIKDYSGNDTYLFAKGDSWDTVTDNAGNDKIVFGTGINKNDVTFAKEGNDLTVKINGTSDGMSVVNWFSNAKYKIETVKFQDGTSLTSADIENLINGVTPPPTDPIDITGTPNNDNLVGNKANNIIDGLASADTMAGGLGDDTYIVDNAGDIVIENFNEGIDTIKTSVTHSLEANVENLTLTGMNTINGTGNDLNNAIKGNNNANSLYGVNGNDTLIGGAGNDTIDGGNGVDRVEAGDGDDLILVSGNNVDTIIGGKGNDTIVFSQNLDYNGEKNLVLFNRGDGQDKILANYDSQGDTNCLIQMGEGITKDDLEFNSYKISPNQDEYSEEVYIKLKNSTDSIYIANHDMYGEPDIWYNVQLSDGTQINLQEVLAPNQIIGTNGNDTLYVNEPDWEVVQGLDGDDIIRPAFNSSYLDPSDTIIGGRGNDTIQSGDGDDVIVFNSGDGQDTLLNSYGNDVIKFGSGISKTDLLFTQNGNNVIVNIGNTDKIEVQDWYNNSITNLEFADNSTLTKLDIDQLLNPINITGTPNSDNLVGNKANNIIDGLTSADTMAGGLGDDTYITDNVGDVVIENPNEGIDTIKSSVTYKLDILGANVENLTLTGTDDIYGGGNELDNVITGNDGNNKLLGREGNDTLFGGFGNDNLFDGLGDDLLQGGTGDDIYHVVKGTGADTIFDEGGNDSVRLLSANAIDLIDKSQVAILAKGSDLLISVDASSLLTIQNFSSPTNAIEKVLLNSEYDFMTNTDINKLVQDMSSYMASHNELQINTTADVRQNADLMAMVTSAWHA